MNKQDKKVLACVDQSHFADTVADYITYPPSTEADLAETGNSFVRIDAHHDRRAGLGGRLGAEAPLVPVEVTISKGGGTGVADVASTYRFGVVDDPLLTPSLVFWALYNSLLVEGSDAALQTVTYRLEAEWSGDPGLEAEPLVLAGKTSGPDGVRSLAGQWMAPLSLLQNNPFTAVRLERVRAWR